MKKVLAILLVVLFVVSVTVATVSAAKNVRAGNKAVVKKGNKAVVKTGNKAIVKTGNKAVVRTGNTKRHVVITGNRKHPRAHYCHGHYYANCDWVWEPCQARLGMDLLMVLMIKTAKIEKCN
jgi:hypothetical protein